MLDRVLREYRGQIRLIFKDFPLESHRLALGAHQAARCAGVTGKYWEYHDLLFEAQPRFTRDELIGYAAELGLSRDSFVRCLDSERFKPLVERDSREGREAGVRGTPTFFVNGRALRGAGSYEAFKELIDQAIGDRKERKTK